MVIDRAVFSPWILALSTWLLALGHRSAALAPNATN
jgi:hypothetical protein